MKPTTRRIVCATDFSDNARAAADVAAAIALRLRALLVLVHVADETGTYHEGTREFRAMMRRGNSMLRKENLRLRREGAVVEDVLLHGRWAEDAILEFLEKNPPAFVIVSSVSKTEFDRWTIGSVSERIAQQSPVPILVVREPARLLAWAREGRDLNVMVAVDFTAVSDAALSWVKELRKIGPCAITATHISWPPDDLRAAGATKPTTKITPSVRRRLIRDVEQRAGELLDGAVAVRVETNWGRPDYALVRLAADMDADLLVLGSHQRHGLQRLAHPSISRGVMRHATMSVACVPLSVATRHGLGHHPRLRRVLVATDFSAAGDSAVPWAYALVPSGGIVKLVHIIAASNGAGPVVPRHNPKHDGPGEAHVRIKVAGDHLAALVPPETDTVSTELEVIVERDVARGINHAARAFGPDVICLGARRRSALAEKFAGSTVRAVIAGNTHPVLLVRPPPP